MNEEELAAIEKEYTKIASVILEGIIGKFVSPETAVTLDFRDPAQARGVILRSIFEFYRENPIDQCPAGEREIKYL